MVSHHTKLVNDVLNDHYLVDKFLDDIVVYGFLDNTPVVRWLSEKLLIMIRLQVVSS